MASRPIIVFEDVSRVYREGHREVQALRGVSLSVEAGEFVALVGPSGSGKSTLLHLAACLDVPTSGRVLIDGQDTLQMPDRALTLLRRREIGLVFQFFNLLPALTVVENAGIPALLAGGTAASVRPKAVALLDRMRLHDRLEHLPEELSGGEMQRVAIARALINDPPILLADEPTGNLDSVTGGEILALLGELREGRTLVIATHDAAVASSADRIIRVRDGRTEA